MVSLGGMGCKALLAPLALKLLELSTQGGGKSTCPPTAGLLYSGITRGTHQNIQGDTASGSCPGTQNNSLELRYSSGVNGDAFIWGSDYEFLLQGSHFHDVPCAVCYVPSRSTVLMEM